jgi:hypothetical protein
LGSELATFASDAEAALSGSSQRSSLYRRQLFEDTIQATGNKKILVAVTYWSDQTLKYTDPDNQAVYTDAESIQFFTSAFAEAMQAAENMSYNLLSVTIEVVPTLIEIGQKTPQETLIQSRTETELTALGYSLSDQGGDLVSFHAMLMSFFVESDFIAIAFPYTNALTWSGLADTAGNGERGVSELRVLIVT